MATRAIQKAAMRSGGRWEMGFPAFLCAAMLVLSTTSTAIGQDTGPSGERQVSREIGEVMLEQQACLSDEETGCDVEALSALFGRDLTDFERLVILRLRAAIHFSEDRLVEAIADLEAALATGAATVEDQIRVRINIAQLYIATGETDLGIAAFEHAVRDGAAMDANLAMMMAQAYAQAERFENGLPYAQLAFDLADPRERRHFDLLLLYYQQLGRAADQRGLLQQMVELWPDDERLWEALIAILARQGDEADAFAVHRLMYLNGMAEEEWEIIRLAQYFSYFEYPYRGATFLEREMNAGRVSRSPENLRTLANLLRQAREFERAIPVLRQLAEQTGDGQDSVKLAEALYQASQLPEAESAFEEALERGGFDRMGDAWAMLGTVRYEMGDREGAFEAFTNCLELEPNHRACRGWEGFLLRQEIHQNHVEIPASVRERVHVEECRNEVWAERQLRSDTAVQHGMAVVRTTVTVPERCQPYFNSFGDQIAGPGFEAGESAIPFVEDAPDQ